MRTAWLLLYSVILLTRSFAAEIDARGVAEDIVAVFGREKLPDEEKQFGDVMLNAANQVAQRHGLTLDLVRSSLAAFVKGVRENRKPDAYDQALVDFLTGNRFDAESNARAATESILAGESNPQQLNALKKERLWRTYLLQAVSAEWVTGSHRTLPLLQNALTLCDEVGTPSDKADVRFKIATVYTRMGLNEAAQKQWAELAEDVFHRKGASLESGIVLGWYGLSELRFNHPKAAAFLLQKSIQWRKKTFPQPSKEEARWLGYRAQALFNASDFSTAADAAREELRIIEIVYKDDYERIFACLERLARSQKGAGDFASAEKTYRRWLEAYAASWIIRSNRKFGIQWELAACIEKLGRDGEAAAIREEVETKRREIGDNTDVPPDLVAVRDLQREQEGLIVRPVLTALLMEKRYAEAERLCRAEHRDAVKLSGNDRSKLWPTLTDLAIVLALQRKGDEAKTLFRSAMEERHAAHADTSQLWLSLVMSFASALRQGGEPQAADDLIQETIERLSKLSGPESPRVKSLKELLRLWRALPPEPLTLPE